MSLPDALNEQLEQLRRKWPQAHVAEGQDGNGNYLVFLPGMVLPKGWDSTICTALFLARVHEPCLSHGHGTASALNGFFVDIQDLRLADKSQPRRTMTDVPVLWEVEPHLTKPCGYGQFDREDWDRATEIVFRDPKRCWGELRRWPQWRGLTRFGWVQQHYDPNHHTLFTSAMLIRQRLQYVH